MFSNGIRKLHFYLQEKGLQADRRNVFAIQIVTVGLSKTTFQHQTVSDRVFLRVQSENGCFYDLKP